MKHGCTLALIALLALSCGGGDSGTGPGNGGGGGGGGDPVPTAPGVPDGAPSTTTIGPAGGTLASSDGMFTLDVPPGALGADTDVTIQPITNTAWGGTGKGYRLTPDGLSFAAPVALVFGIPDTLLAGTAPEFVEVATQRDDGVWGTLANRTVDTGAGTLAATSRHFSDYTIVATVKIVPARKTLRTGQSTALNIRACFQQVYTGGDDDLFGLIVDCSEEIAPLADFDPWSVNGTVGGNGTVGRVNPTDGQRVVYTAPDEEPFPNVVAVTVETNFGGRNALLHARIRILGTEQWIGPATIEFESGQKIEAEVTWKQTQVIGTLKFFEPTGFVSYTIGDDPDCVDISFFPDAWIIGVDDGLLTIDYSTNPPTYFGAGATYWEAEHCYQCLSDPAQCTPTGAGGGWFGGDGELTDDGTSIKGIVLDGDMTQSFWFVKSQPPQP